MGALMTVEKLIEELGKYDKNSKVEFIDGGTVFLTYEDYYDTVIVYKGGIK